MGAASVEWRMLGRSLGCGDTRLLPERTVEKHVLRGQPSSFTYCEKDRHTGSITDMGRRGPWQVEEG